MSQVKWIKIVTDIFDDEKVLLIESMPEADSIIVIWFKLLCLAGKKNNSGVFLLNDRIPYTDEMLATIFRRPVNTIRLALKTFEGFGMIEMVNNTITIPNWSKHQTLDQIEEKNKYMKNYMRKYREKQKLLASGDCKVNGKTNSKVNVSETELERELELEEDIDKDNNTISKDIVSSTKVQPIVDKWNSLELQKVISIKPGTNRYKLLNARVKEYGIDKVIDAIGNINKSSFLKGQNNKGWTITFDWLIKPNNFLKVLEGNYEDKDSKNNKPKNNYGDKKNKFCDYEQRDYDFGELEKKILGWE
ncbi:phage replisome organizer N-terminal domain-containing protein [Hathewaya histolytica]|uniref:Phage protein n=1 Tax=Hathewaya histolytica TaxID=1498 RepID=A0A4U9RM02_HATHI|nr:phage replisome organizer N-terminal domain-containing protein [Hathewaya histolytica]VTQ89890.1 phage protein [Hathewaya histolytica]